MKCKKCNIEMECKKDILLLSNPPQIKFICPKCGKVEYKQTRSQLWK